MPRTLDLRLIRISELVLTLPNAERKIFGSHAQFLIRKKTFAYFLDNHHGDGIVSVSCRVLPNENTALVNARPRRYYLPAYVGLVVGWRCGLIAAESIGMKSANSSSAVTFLQLPNALPRNSRRGCKTLALGNAGLFRP